MIFLALSATVLLVWLIFRQHMIETVPREEYLKVIWEWKLFTKQEWINEILIRNSVSQLLKREISKRRNSFNLRRLVYEGLIEYQEGETWFSGEVVVPIATFRVTERGIDEYQGSPP